MKKMSILLFSTSLLATLALAPATAVHAADDEKQELKTTATLNLGVDDSTDENGDGNWKPNPDGNGNDGDTDGDGNPDGNGDNNNNGGGSTVPSNKLMLLSAPSFNFGTLGASNLYNGFSNRPAEGVSDALSVSDTRLGQDDWTLSLSMSEFKGATSTLKNAAMKLAAVKGEHGATPAPSSNVRAWHASNAITVSDTGTAQTVAESDGTTHGTVNYNFNGTDSRLGLGINNELVVEAGEKLVSDLTWDLVGDQPAADKL